MSANAKTVKQKDTIPWSEPSPADSFRYVNRLPVRDPSEIVRRSFKCRKNPERQTKETARERERERRRCYSKQVETTRECLADAALSWV
jgi:hypothetical protein